MYIIGVVLKFVLKKVISSEFNIFKKDNGLVSAKQ